MASMDSLEEREKGFERKFVSDQELEFRATSRRNRMLGEWAARLMELEHVEDYAQAVIKSHLEHHGDEDVLRKVSEDLSASGMADRASEVPAKMDEFLALARDQVKSGV